MLPLVADAPDQRAQPVDLVVVEAARRLVEQQQLRPRRERARKLDALLDAERQIGDAALRDVGQIEEVDQLPGDVASVCSSRLVQGSRSALLRKSRAAERMAADAHVVEHRHGAEQREVLERAADADVGDAMRRPVEDAAAVEQDVAASSACRAG